MVDFPSVRDTLVCQYVPFGRFGRWQITACNLCVYLENEVPDDYDILGDNNRQNMCERFFEIFFSSVFFFIAYYFYFNAPQLYQRYRGRLTPLNRSKLTLGNTDLQCAQYEVVNL